MKYNIENILRTKTSPAWISRFFRLLLVAGMVVSLSALGCSRSDHDKEGPMEEAGKKADQAIEKADQEMDEAMGTVKEESKEAYEKTEESLNKAGKAMGEAMEDAGKKMEKTDEEIQQ